MQPRSSFRDKIHASARRRHFEPLEDRRLLTLTVITPDAGGEFPAWVYDMGTAVARRDGTFDTRDQNGNSIPDVIENAHYRYGEERQLVGTGLVYDDLILADWSGEEVNEDTVTALGGLIHERLAVEPDVLDIHFIGHGWGARLNYKVVSIAEFSWPERIGFVQVTTLDPKFLDGENSVAANDPSNIVDFADNYYQTIPAVEPTHGVPVSGALNFNLSANLDAWLGRTAANPSQADHEEVHDWYQWTIAPGVVSDDGAPQTIDSELPVPTIADRPALRRLRSRLEQ